MSLDDAKNIEARKTRFLRELRANNLLIDCMNEVLDKSESAIKLRSSGAERDLDLLVAAMHGKAGKTYQAIFELCWSGFGEDALILLRSNINLMINLLYILADDSIARSKALIAVSLEEQEKYLRLAYNARPPWVEKLNWNDIAERAGRWREESIAVKAEKAKQFFHYDVGYRFYSSIEHSDAWALSRFIREDETTINIRSERSDEYVRIALIHNFGVMANIFFAFCSHFKIVDRTTEEKVTEEWKNLGKDS